MRGLGAVACLLAVALAGCAASPADDGAGASPDDEGSDRSTLTALDDVLQQAGLGSYAQNLEGFGPNEPAVEGVVQAAADGSLVEGAVVRLRCQENVVFTTEEVTSSPEATTDAGSAAMEDALDVADVGGGNDGAAEGTGTGPSSATAPTIYEILGPMAHAVTDAEGRFSFPAIEGLTDCQTPIYEAEAGGLHMVAPLVAPPLVADEGTVQFVVLALAEDA